MKKNIHIRHFLPCLPLLARKWSCANMSFKSHAVLWKHFHYKYRSSSGPRQNGRMMSMRSFMPPSASSASLKKKKKLWERSLHSSGEAFWFIVNGTFQKLSGECHCCLRYIAFFFIASISCMLLTWIYKYNVLLTLVSVLLPQIYNTQHQSFPPILTSLEMKPLGYLLLSSKNYK